MDDEPVAEVCDNGEELGSISSGHEKRRLAAPLLSSRWARSFDWIYIIAFIEIVVVGRVKRRQHRAEHLDYRQGQVDLHPLLLISTRPHAAAFFARRAGAGPHASVCKRRDEPIQAHISRSG